MMDHDFVGALAILLIFGAPIAAWITTRVLAHNERMEMIRRGMAPPPVGMHFPPPAYGAMPPPPMGKPGKYAPPGYDDYYYGQRQLRKGVQLTFIGFALFVGLGSIGPLSHIGFAGPWLLGGLIPMFIGLAQVVNAVLNGAQIPGFNAGRYGNQQMHFGPPPPAAGPPPSQPPGSGPYAWRPGPTPEIERPVPPPEKR